MLALSVKQPWAALIESGRKTLEIRTWSTRYRGPLAIVASSRPNEEACARFGMRDLPCGVTICTVDLVDVRPVRLGHDDAAACCRVGPGDLAWVLENPRPLRRRAVKGRLRLFDLADDRIVLMVQR